MIFPYLCHWSLKMQSAKAFWKRINSKSFRHLSQVISDVPADSLFRTERPPTKEIMRYFIRHYAQRLGMGESAPWVVEDELVKKFNLPSKFSDFLLDPHKVIYSWQFPAYYLVKMWLALDLHSYVCLKFLAENPSTKRRSLTSPEGKSRKRLKTPDTPGEDSGNEQGEKKRKKKTDGAGMPLSPTIWGHMQVSWLSYSHTESMGCPFLKVNDLLKWALVIFS